MTPDELRKIRWVVEEMVPDSEMMAAVHEDCDDSCAAKAFVLEWRDRVKEALDLLDRELAKE